MFIFLVGCGYKATPFYVEAKEAPTQENKDEIIDKDSNKKPLFQEIDSTTTGGWNLDDDG